jgi:DNA-binding Xre family transcriptional regulator
MPIRFRLSEILKKREITAYRLAKDTGLALTTVYRMTSAKKRPGVVEWTTLEKVCDYLDVEPGELLVRVRGRPS